MTTPTTGTQRGQSLSEMSSFGDVSINVNALDVKNIKSIQLASGWYNVTDCEIVQFAIGESHSPITPSQLYPTLRYKTSDGMVVYTSLKNILSYSENRQNREGIWFSNK